MSWYLAVLKNYVGFSGRARRKEYWMFVLFNVIAALVLGTIDGLLGLGFGDSGLGILSTLYNLAVLIPSIAVTVRRLHDTDRSAWWLLLYLVPFIGALVIFVLTLLEGTRGDNHFGSDPKAADMV